MDKKTEKVLNTILDFLFNIKGYSVSFLGFVVGVAISVMLIIGFTLGSGGGIFESQVWAFIMMAYCFSLLYLSSVTEGYFAIGTLLLVVNVITTLEWNFNFIDLIVSFVFFLGIIDIGLSIGLRLIPPKRLNTSGKRT